MLSQEQSDFINATLGITADELAKAISNEQEVALELPKGRFITKENEDKMLDAHGKRRYDAGTSKTLKEIFNGKSKDDFLNDFKQDVLKEAQLEPSEKLTQLNKTVTSLKESLELKDKEILDIKTKSDNVIKRTNALSSLPTLREDLGINKQEALDIVLSSVEQKEDGIYKGGQLIVNQHQEAVSLNDFLSQEVVSRGWTKKEVAGNAGKTPGGTTGKISSYSEFEKVCKSKEWNPGSYKAKEYLKSTMNKNPEFDMEN